MSPGDDVCDGVDRYGVTVWYFNDVERQQARQRYALQGTVSFIYSLMIVLFREVVRVCVIFSYVGHRKGAKYCDQHVYVSVCMCSHLQYRL